MLTDEELTTRLSAAFHEALPELTYAGPVPHVRRSGTGLAATSAVTAVATLVLLPAAIQRDDSRTPNAVPDGSPRAPSSQPEQRVVRTLDIAGLHLTFASTEGDPGPLYLVGGPDLTVPPDAEQVDVDVPGRVWFVDHPASGDPQVYVAQRTCPDTTAGCNGAPPQRHVYGILAPGWTREQLRQLLEHPVATQRGLHH